MATCKDCIHYEVCVVIENLVDKEQNIYGEFGCEDFKNEADVVEVVRCKDCIYCDLDDRCEAPENGLIREYVKPDDFCSYGERKDT